MSDTEIEALKTPAPWSDIFDSRSEAVLRLTDAMCGQTHVLDAALVADLRMYFNETELAELVLVAGQANLNNRAGNAAKQLLGD